MITTKIEYNNEIYQIADYGNGSIIIWRGTIRHGYFSSEIENINTVSNYKLAEIIKNISLYKEVLNKYKTLINLL